MKQMLKACSCFALAIAISYGAWSHVNHEDTVHNQSHETHTIQTNERAQQKTTQE